MAELQPYQSAWADEFTREAARIIEAASGRLDAIEHIGSTSVPSMIAKPIIDLAARAAITADPFGLEAALGQLGYRLHSAGPKTHAVYVRTIDDRRTHILHVFTADQWPTCNQRLFRDKLLRDPIARERYRELKEEISPNLDGRAYTAAKTALIEELLNQEREARGLPPTKAWDK